MAQQIATTTALAGEVIPEFTASVRGEVVRPGNADYEAARRVWNGMIDRRPALILRCMGPADVASGVRFARAHSLPIAVRGGAHNVAGYATCDGGLVLDLARMKGVRVDPAARTVQAQAGLTWGELDRETQLFSLATTGGMVSTTGVAGFTLGGGIGWLVRKHGLACDNLRAVDLVTADGELLTASATQNPDLLWAVRGGGGNFGVVTSFEFQLHPVGPTVLGGLVLHPAARAREVLRFHREYVAAAPDELTTVAIFLTVPPAPFLPEALHGTPAIAIAACYAGDLGEGERVVAPLREFGPPAADLLHPLPYAMLQGMFDEGNPPGMQNYWKSHYLAGLGDKAIEALVGRAAAMRSPLSALHLHHLGGAASRIPAGGTSFAHRDGAFVLNIIGLWTDPAESEQHTRWVRDTWDAMAPYATGGAYLNFMGEGDGAERVLAAYGPGFERLAALKRAYDPTNVFRLNLNIPPGA